VPRACLLNANVVVVEDGGEGDASEVGDGGFVVAGGKCRALGVAPNYRRITVETPRLHTGAFLFSYVLQVF
jgi:hypothetical protein